MSPVMVLVVAGVIALVAAGILLTLIIGIRLGDRSHLASAPRSQSDAFVRRLLVGIRRASESSEEPDK
jgi:hypothetical protein